MSKIFILRESEPQPAFTCSKSIIETLEQGMKYVHISHLVLGSIVNFEHVVAGWELKITKFNF